ncbi:hypothetical protein P152DRAFT_451984 [Eremomyces bilateralis CBS 781.70]|uniref:Uncharacterized protein n=1 Tax=Eremomyces bilateralis CBS 781.70 TaxID=1392243 RepID=A0A6G1FV04_9PEZI|nr:uncharacterized protein P152DRAFT_451984 [Eremomyces bilateralis CBS 781.70]KAF1809538.1 hypothetical protein P152DRAFT_451984 [Eremomyces bilateralis CBS 781.70]
MVIDTSGLEIVLHNPIPRFVIESESNPAKCLASREPIRIVWGMGDIQNGVAKWHETHPLLDLIKVTSLGSGTCSMETTYPTTRATLLLKLDSTRKRLAEASEGQVKIWRKREILKAKLEKLPKEKTRKEESELTNEQQKFRDREEAFCGGLDAVTHR